jgi:quercetin dioxygenase-like cupin family protein
MQSPPEASREHPLKVVVEEVPSDRSLRPQDGWIDMDVKWLLTRESVGATETVVGRTVLPPGASHALHRHPNAEEWEYVLAGEGVKKIGDSEIAIAPGEIVFAPKNAPHALANTSSTEPLVTLWGYCGAGSLAEAGYILVTGV